MPTRVQRSRKKGWKMPPNAVTVSRPSIFGNPFSIEEAVEFHQVFGRPENGETPRDTAVRWYREWMAGWNMDSDVKPPDKHLIAMLRGKDLVCWCRLDQPCHADVLLQLANT